MNMWLMSVTLDVSKLSGWLNADAFCRVTTGPKGLDTARGERREGGGGGGGGGGAHSVHGGSDRTLEGTARARGRTRNMPRIFVTLDVSKLSGWLNADASCRVTRRHVEGGTRG